MKKLITACTLLLALVFTNTVKAQAWEKDTKLLGIGLGPAYYYHIGTADRYYPGWFTRLTGQFNFYGEFGVHEYVGVGFNTGIGGAGQLTGYYPEVNVPLQVIANFHFYQLIADKVSKDIHADKLDIYAGINAGSGVAAVFDGRTGDTRIFPLLVVGPQFGVRYYFKENVGVTGEFGYGKSLIQAGFVFKL